MKTCRPNIYTLRCLDCGQLCVGGDCKCVPQPFEPIRKQPARGPGTELKRLLARVGIASSPDCACNARAAEMDWREHETPGWCEANIETIVGWLREQAEARGLPFLDAVGRMLVRRAIKNARARPDFNDQPQEPQSTS